MDGGLDAQTIRLEGNIGRRTVGVSSIIVSFAGRERIGDCVEEPFAGQFSSVKALFPMLGAAVLARELAGLPWSAIDLSKLKLHATGKGTPGSQKFGPSVIRQEGPRRTPLMALPGLRFGYRPASQSSSLRDFNRHVSLQ
jgi:hypothetical protein